MSTDNPRPGSNWPGPTWLDEMRVALGAREGETVIAAAERVRAERDEIAEDLEKAMRIADRWRAVAEECRDLLRKR